MDPRPIKHYSFHNVRANEKRGIWCLERGWRKGRQMVCSWHSALVCDVQTREAPSLPLRVHLTATSKVVLPSASACLCVWVCVSMWVCECVWTWVWASLWMYEYVNMCIWAWMCDYVSVGVWLWTCVWGCEHVSVNMRVCVSMGAWVCEYVSVNMRVCVSMCVSGPGLRWESEAFTSYAKFKGAAKTMV